MQQLDLFDILKDTSKIKPQEIPTQKISWVQSWVKDQMEEIIHNLLSYHFTKGRFSSYKIEIEWWKIKKVLFSSWKEKFQVFFSYEYEIKNVRQFNYTETDPDEREKIIQTLLVKNLKIEKIQKKVSVWYGELKQSANYFRYLWLDNYSLTIFLEELIKKFHTWT